MFTILHAMVRHAIFLAFVSLLKFSAAGGVPLVRSESIADEALSLLQVQAAKATRDVTCACKFCPGNEMSAEVATFMGGHVVNESFPEEHLIPGESGPFPVVGDAHLRSNATILVLVSGLQDPRCAATIANVFTRSSHPERMRVGMVDQNTPNRTGYDCVSTYCDIMQQRGFAKCPYLDQIETLRVDAEEARGPAWARAGGAQFVRLEEHDFCLQVDAHTDFAKGFDVVLPRMWAQTGNEYAILSTYVNQVRGQVTKDGAWKVNLLYEVPTLCGVGGGTFHRNTIASAAKCLSRPLLQRTWGAGLSFAKCHFETRVPNDPYLMGVFDGEEFSRYLRAWTHGYDVYAPHRAVVFHDYGSPLFHTGWFSSHGEHMGPTRIRKLMTGAKDALAQSIPIRDVEQDLGPYGLGAARSVEQYEIFSGLDIRHGGGGSDQDERCANLRYVPYSAEPGRMQKAPVPPADTKLPRSIKKGSDKTAWPALHGRRVPANDAQRFVLSEVEDTEPGFRAVSSDTLLTELGVAIPPGRTAY